MHSIAKLAAAALLALGLEGCAGDVIDYAQMPREHGHTVTQNDDHKPLQCAPYAREHSAIKIYGDAYTWWDKAAGRYARGAAPQAGSVMVLSDYAGPTRGHVAVVRRVVGAHEIRVDHANWLDDGAIYVNDPVEDVSDAGDWSQVRVYNLKTGGWGAKAYPVQGFIGSGSDSVGQADPMAGSNAGATSLVGEIN
jgi:hypothetical protein